MWHPSHMITAPKRKSVVFATLGVCLVAARRRAERQLDRHQLARRPAAGARASSCSRWCIAGLVLNTVFLVREVRRSEQHDAFINAVTHELKTPVASIRLYLETLERRELPQEKRREFYRVMIDDIDRLLQLIEQVLRAAAHQRASAWCSTRCRVDLRDTVRECLDLARMRHHLEAEALCTRSPGQSAAGDRARRPRRAEGGRSRTWWTTRSSTRNGGARGAWSWPRCDERRVAIRVTDQGIGISRRS